MSTKQLKQIKHNHKVENEKKKNNWQTSSDNWENVTNVIRKEVIRKIVATIMVKFPFESG